MKQRSGQSAGKNDLYFDIWLAGFIDADGCIGLHKQTYKNNNNINYVPSISITTTCQKTFNHLDLEMKKRKIGHHVTFRKVKNPNWKDRWQIEARGMKRCKPFLRRILPYLVTKKDEGILLLRYIESRTSGIMKKPYSEKEFGFIKEIARLKTNR